VSIIALGNGSHKVSGRICVCQPLRNVPILDGYPENRICFTRSTFIDADLLFQAWPDYMVGVGRGFCCHENLQTNADFASRMDAFFDARQPGF
jgi:hypothetical protein